MKRLMLVLVVFLSTFYTKAQWQQTNGPYGGQITCFLVDSTNIYAGTFGSGVFKSTNNGSSWTQMNTGLQNIDEWSLVISGTYLYAGTFGSGVWKYDLTDITKIYETNNNEISFGVYPNPANDVLFIDLDKESTLEIVNIHGQIVDIKCLAEKSNSLDISNLVTGVYTLRIKTDRGIAIKKLIKQ